MSEASAPRLPERATLRQLSVGGVRASLEADGTPACCGIRHAPGPVGALRWRGTKCPRAGVGADGAVMRGRVITMPPSAELRRNSKKPDSLLDDSVLDPNSTDLIERDPTSSRSAPGDLIGPWSGTSSARWTLRNASGDRALRGPGRAAALLRPGPAPSPSHHGAMRPDEAAVWR